MKTITRKQLHKALNLALEAGVITDAQGDHINNEFNNAMETEMPFREYEIENMLEYWGDELNPYIAEEVDQISLIRSNNDIPSAGTDSDFAVPFPDEFPEFVLFGDDEGYMWEFVSGKLVGQTCVQAGDMLGLRNSPNPANKLKAMLANGTLPFDRLGRDLSRARM